MKARINIVMEKDGTVWYEAEKRVWFFFWTKWFGNSTYKSTNREDAKKFVDNYNRDLK